MKKLLHYLTTFINLFMLCSAFIVKNQTNVYAEEEKKTKDCVSGLDFTNSKNEGYSGCSSTIGTYGKLSISKAGAISLSYKYGISELLVYVYKGTLGVKTGEDKEQGVHLIHVSGQKVSPDKVIKEEWESVTVHLFKYIEYDEEVKLYLVYDFATESDYNSGAYNKDGTDLNTGFFDPLFCKTADRLANCMKAGEANVIGNSAKLRKQIDARTNHFLIGRNQKNVPVDYQDRYALVYTGATARTHRKMDLNLINTDIDIYAVDTYKIYSVNLIVDNSAAEGTEEEVEHMVYDIVIPVMLGVLGLAAVVTCTMLGYQIVKSADSPEERSGKIKTLRSILIGLAIAFVMLLVVKPVISFIKGYME